MNDKIEIRPAQPSDADYLSSLLGQLGYPAPADEVVRRLSRLGAFPYALALVALDGVAAVGLITAHMFPTLHATEPIAYLTTLVVAESHRGMGVGSELVLHAERWAAEQGAARMSVTSALHRHDTHGFYERRTYERTGLRFTKTLVNRERAPGT